VDAKSLYSLASNSQFFSQAQEGHNFRQGFGAHSSRKKRVLEFQLRPELNYSRGPVVSGTENAARTLLSVKNQSKGRIGTPVIGGSEIWMI
jgi:hypothetical protein